MGSKSGSGTIKTNLRKVKSGYDQEFTLQKGVSAAPIKQVSIKNTYTNPKPVVKTKKEIGKGWDLISKKTIAKMDSQIKQMGAKKIEWKAPPKDYKKIEFKFKKSRKTMINQFKKALGLKD